MVIQHLTIRFLFNNLEKILNQLHLSAKTCWCNKFCSKWCLKIPRIVEENSLVERDFMRSFHNSKRLMETVALTFCCWAVKDGIFLQLLAVFSFSPIIRTLFCFFTLSYMLKSCAVVKASKLSFEHRLLEQSISEVRRNGLRFCMVVMFPEETRWCRNGLSEVLLQVNISYGLSVQVNQVLEAQLKRVTLLKEALDESRSEHGQLHVSSSVSD